ncbi:MAG: hypothetical protein L3K25_15580 [Gammaproteobacteria bacterium]|nr:hypothetical protein [Gammaproteobacteria bacterium]
MTNKNKKFVYQDAKGNITFREVTNISESDDYIQGRCLKDNGIRTFRKDRVLEDIENNEIAPERLQFYIDNKPQLSQSSKNRLARKINQGSSPEVCFTGFKKPDKDRLIQIAESANMFIRSSVTVNLNYLCCGYNAGPKKIETSRHQGTVVLSEKQFLNLIETGEIPEET